jgi:AcrR family transcriptional regulator
LARLPNPRIREKLLDQTVAYVLSNGMGALTLRPLAKALRTNARMLIYHFGSREGLMREVLARLREREDARIQAWFLSSKTRASKKRRTLPEFLRWQWQCLSSPQARSAVRLIFELYTLALLHPREYPGVLEDPLAYWKKLAEQSGVDSKTGEVEATLLLAMTRGLLLDLCATGDRARVGKAMNMFARLVENLDAPAKKQKSGKGQK